MKTVTFTAPAFSTGVVAVISVLETTLKLLDAVDPKSTAVVPRKFVPVIVTVEPPAEVPLDGETPVTVGGWGVIDALVLKTSVAFPSSTKRSSLLSANSFCTGSAVVIVPI